jgi:DNA polymerase-1
MDPATRRIHTNLNQTGTVSGRISSSDPNLQNVPIRTEQGRLIRKAFIAPPGHVLLKVDYSQIELRILAHITGDEPLVEAFNSGQDVHARTAADLFKVPIESVDSEMRRKAKMTNYAIAYGVSGFGLAKQLGTASAAEAQEFINRYFEALPGVARYIAETLQSARSAGYVQTLLGRRRPIPEIHASRAQERAAAERTAINHPIQGTAADIMKLAMLAVDGEMRAQGFAARMTMQVHDELVFEVPDDEVQAVALTVSRLMREVPTQALHLHVPLDVDVGVGPNWDDTVPWASSPASAAAGPA